MKKVVVLLLIVVFCLVVCGCSTTKKLRKAFDLEQYDGLNVEITIVRNDEVLVEEITSVTQQSNGRFKESIYLKKLADLDHHSPYYVIEEEKKHDSLADYMEPYGIDLNSLTDQQLAKTKIKDDSRYLMLEMTEEELDAFLQDKRDFYQGSPKLEVVFDKELNILKSFTYTYLTQNDNEATLRIEFLQQSA